VVDSLDLTPYMYKIQCYGRHYLRVRIACAEGYAHELAHRLRMHDIHSIAKSRGTVEISRQPAVVWFLQAMDLMPDMRHAVNEYALLLNDPARRELDVVEVVRRIIGLCPKLEYRPKKTRAYSRDRRRGKIGS